MNPARIPARNQERTSAPTNNRFITLESGEPPRSPTFGRVQAERACTALPVPGVAGALLR